MELIVTDVNGWSKVVEIEKAITRLGSAPSADIQLTSKEISPLQFQILSNPDLPTGCRIVNLADPLEIFDCGISHPVEPYATYDINNRDEIQLGEFRVVFCLPLTTTLVRSSNIIQASITFMDTLLQPDLDLHGRLVIKNLGDKKACQFHVSLKGLPQECYHIDPIPLLYPGAQEEVQVQLIHKITYPQAGLHDLFLNISAPEFYPGEEVVIKQGIYVAPVFRQEIEILDDIQVKPIPTVTESVNTILTNEQAAVSPLAEEKDVLLPVVSNNIIEIQVETPRIEAAITKTDQPEQENLDQKTETQINLVGTGEKDLQADPSAGVINTEIEKNSNKHDLDLSKVKVVRSQTENFWTE